MRRALAALPLLWLAGVTHAAPSLPPNAAAIEPAAFSTPPQQQCADIPVTKKRAKAYSPPPQAALPQPTPGTTALAPPAESSGLSDMGSLGAVGSGAGGGMAAKSMPPSAAAEPSAPMAPPPAPPKASAGAGSAAKAKKESAAAPHEEARAEAPAARSRAPAPPPVEAFPTEPTTKYLSADDSNSMASATIARKLIRSRRYVHPDYVRTYELLNYYSFDYPAPSDGAEIAVVPEMRAGAADGEYSFQIAVRGPERRRDEMRPLNAVVLLDVSGSMAGEPFALAGSFVKKLARRLRPGEKLSVVTIARAAKTLLSETVDSGTPARVDAALGALTPTDITNFERGLAAAYELASKSYDAKMANRVLVLSDGAANAGDTTKKVIAKHAEDADKQGIYLAGIAVGEGFDDMLMNAVTDKGRGAYAFLDGESEIDRLLEDRRFVATFDVAVKDVRLKLVLPPGWKVKEFHGEQMSSVASEVVPQYLSPNDQMLYSLVVATNTRGAALDTSRFELEAEYRPLGAPAKRLALARTAKEMLGSRHGLAKGDAVVRYAETLKAIRYPLEPNREANLRALDAGLAYVSAAYDAQPEAELRDIVALMKAYRRTLSEGEAAVLACDRQFDSPPVVLGLRPEWVESVTVRGPAPDRAVRALERLRDSTRLLPLEGARFLAIASGVVGTDQTTSSQLSDDPFADPQPAFMGAKRLEEDSSQPVYDLHQVALKLRAPPAAKSFSFALNYFSAEYPEYVQASYNDTFYAILEARSTNKGRPTNISFDPKNQSIEVDNNYFENTFHPIPNTGTGFDGDGSTGWLRTSWPIEGGETFTLTLSVHDEGDGIYDSLVLLDDFQFHDYAAVGNTDPLN
jgi:Ca-activated chloride channel homolog